MKEKWHQAPLRSSAATREKVAFYSVSSSRYFLGAAAMINSLRLAGHREQIFVADAGLRPFERELLASHVELVEAPPGTPPWLLKTRAPLRRPAPAMVLIDADMILTRPLGALIAAAAEGRVLAAELGLERYFPQWAALLARDPRPDAERRPPYLSSGLVLLGGAGGLEVLRLMDRIQAQVEVDRTFVGGDATEYPFHYADQDILNAVLATSVDPARIVALERRSLATPFDALEVLDEGSPRCAHADGFEPLAVHHVLAVKPWLEPTYESPYSRLMRRCLTGPGLALRVPDELLPRHLRPGALSYAERKRADAAARLRWRVGTGLHRARARLGSLPRRFASRQ